MDQPQGFVKKGHEDKSYITSLLKKYALQNAKEFDTPLANSKLAADSEDGPVSWASKKQPTVALSSTEAEYMALTEAAKEATYLRRSLLSSSNMSADVLTKCLGKLHIKDVFKG
ncbi:uncharacterized protein [Choristoneura fumiferana]|uniref:uncharacterized protein n=1 Tax=Choristoneura fumiferana TaxID=7141 RepID=UPI003D15D1A1